MNPVTRFKDITFDTSSALSRSLIAAASCTIGCRGFLTSKLSSQRRLKWFSRKTRECILHRFYFHHHDFWNPKKHLTVTSPADNNLFSIMRSTILFSVLTVQAIWLDMLLIKCVYCNVYQWKRIHCQTSTVSYTHLTLPTNREV